MLRLSKVCGMCPEQYEVFLGERSVGWLNLRHGRFTADCPLHTVVYEARPKEDGSFYDDEDERDFYLREGCKAILAALGEALSEPLYTVE